MAITEVEYRLIKSLRQQRPAQVNARLIELGEQNWYGDIRPEILLEDIAQYARPDRRDALTARLRAALQPGAMSLPNHEIAAVFYAVFLDVEVHDVIDFHGTERAKKLDLNYPLEGFEQGYDLVMNGGTSEHVFDVCQFFRTTHQLAKTGGMMIHVVPFHGWFDHGFYNFQPTFFYDLAKVNQYRMVAMIYSEVVPTKIVQLKDREDWLRFVAGGGVGRNATICTMLQKIHDAPFKVPFQGYYSEEGLSAESKKAWTDLRGNV